MEESLNKTVKMFSRPGLYFEIDQLLDTADPIVYHLFLVNDPMKHRQLGDDFTSIDEAVEYVDELIRLGDAEVTIPAQTLRIRGVWGKDFRTVYVNGVILPPAPSLNLREHSPTGFNWGYSGSGPSQLALAICLYSLGAARALDLYQEFKKIFIAPLEQDKDFVLVVNVQDWAKRYDQGEI